MLQFPRHATKTQTHSYTPMRFPPTTFTQSTKELRSYGRKNMSPRLFRTVSRYGTTPTQATYRMSSRLNRELPLFIPLNIFCLLCAAPSFQVRCSANTTSINAHFRLQASNNIPASVFVPNRKETIKSVLSAIPQDDVPS